MRRFRNLIHTLKLEIFIVNALLTVASWFVAAALYSRYFAAGTAELAVGVNLSSFLASSAAFANNSLAANFTAANATGALSQSAFACKLCYRMPCNQLRHRPYRCQHAHQ